MGNDMPRRFSNCLNTGKIRNITCKEELRAGQGMDREKRMRAWIRAEVMLLFIMMGAFLLRETGRTEAGTGGGHRNLGCGKGLYQMGGLYRIL